MALAGSAGGRITAGVGANLVRWGVGDLGGGDCRADMGLPRLGGVCQQRRTRGAAHLRASMHHS